MDELITLRLEVFPSLARAVPIKIIIVFNIGVPTKDPFNCTPPDIVKRDNNKMIKGTYSNKATWSTS